MPFNLPDTFQKEIAVSTQKVYKSKLNALAAHGFDTVEKIQTQGKQVIDVIKEMTGDTQDEKGRHARRYFLSAIFWAVPFPKVNAYHTYWQKTTPLTVVGGPNVGKKWRKRKDFKE